jgi:hypothetical protein
VNKLGLHILSGFSGDLGKPRVVKLVDVSAAYVRQVRAQVGPDCLIIVRWYRPEQPFGDPVGWVAEHSAEMSAMTDGGRDKNVAFESWNEIADYSADAYCEFELRRMALLHTLGYRNVVGNFAVGTPHETVWRWYRPMLDAMRAGDLLGLHEYWIDTADLGNVWHVGRWRLIPELASVPIVVTECGRDVVEGQGARGWKRTCDLPTMVGDLRQYNALLEQHPNVLGATVFTAGALGEWADFDANVLAPHIVAGYTGQPAPAQPLPPEPPAPEPTTAFAYHPMPDARVSQRFGENPAYYDAYGLAGHNGVDYAVPRGQDVMAWHGAPVFAADSGRAVVVRSDGYGLYVYVYGAKYDTLYAHLSDVCIANDSQVKAGTVLGFVGYTGNCEPMGVKGTHLHFGVRDKPYHLSDGWRGYVDPLPLLPR